MTMRQASTVMELSTSGQRLYELTREVAHWVGEQGLDDGLLTPSCRHTSASWLIQENAAPEVKDDLVAFFGRLAPEDPTLYDHDDEGPDDMPAHLKTALTQVSLTIPLIGGRIALGTWQGIYLFAHHRHPHQRQVVLQLIGD